MKAASALLLLNGNLRGAAAVRSAAAAADVLICADGGARHAARLRLVPDFVVGDMDSLPPTLPRSWRRTSFVSDVDERRSDLDKALALARRLGVRRVSVVGALGGGLDHELVNLAVLEQAAGFELSLLDGGRARLLGPGRHRLGLRRGQRFSLLAAPSARLSLSGARYGLSAERLERGSRGLGNRAEGPGTLSVREGHVWLIESGVRR